MTLPVRNGKIRLTQGTLFWREVGSGPALMFLHGSWQDGSQWGGLMAHLGRQFHCLAPDLMGFGESRRSGKQSYSVELGVTCLVEFVTSLRIPPCVIVADTLGAWVAVRYALQCPDAVRGLVVMAPEGLTHPTLQQRWQRLRWLAAPWSLRVGVLRLVAPLVRLWGGDRWLRQLWQQRRQLRQAEAACKLLFQRRQTALRPEYLDEALPHLTVPVLILQPEQGSPTTHLANKLFYDQVPQAHLVSLPGDESTVWQEGMASIQGFVKDRSQAAIVPMAGRPDQTSVSG